MSNQPEYWLQVKEEYVMENFEKLLHYLHHFDLQSAPVDSGFVTSSDALYNVVKTDLEKTNGLKIYESTEQVWSDINTTTRMIATHLLTAEKRNKPDLATLAQFAHAILMMDKSGTQAVKLKSIIFNCMCERQVKSYKFTWSDLEEEVWNIHTFMAKLGDTEFDEEGQLPTFFYERKGLLAIINNQLTIAPHSLSVITGPQRNNIKSQYELSTGGCIKVHRNNYIKIDDFKNAIAARSALQSSFMNTTVSDGVAEKLFDEGDYLQVIITDKTMFSLTAETFKPGYEKLEGKIKFDGQPFSMQDFEFYKNLAVDDVITVKYTGNPNNPFDVNETFAEFYETLAEDLNGEHVKAIFSRTYHVGKNNLNEDVTGYRWISEQGIEVSIKDEIGEVELHAVENQQPITIVVNETNYDKSGKIVTNGHYINDNHPDDLEFDPDFKDKARKELVLSFRDITDQNHQVEKNDDKRPLAGQYVNFLAHAMFYSALDTETTMDRYEHITAAQMLCEIIENENDNAFIQHDARYVENIVRFASNDMHEKMQLTHPEILNGIEDVEKKEAIIDQLNNYKTQRAETLLQSQQEDTLTAVTQLVEASNTLQSKNISSREISRIKKVIAGKLKVGDIFKTPEDTGTYYGEESETLEFKTSIVFAPTNKINGSNIEQHEVQKWEILKPICGFLNSISGGELLLGVNDQGHPSGLDDDINYLYNKKLIHEPTMDDLRRYVMSIIDKVFIDENKKDRERDITSARINYIIEDNDEKRKILRIRVAPYEYGTVRFIGEGKPENIANSYLRKSGATEKLTEANKKYLTDKKLGSGNDGNNIKILTLKKAIEEKKCVIFKDYISSSRTQNRKVEAYELRIARGAVICFDPIDKANKEFKLSRCSEVSMTSEPWKNKARHKADLKIDLFDFLQGSKEYSVTLKLKNVAYNILIEEYHAKESITPNQDSDKTEYPWITTFTVYNLIGPTGFYVRLAENVKIVDSPELKESVNDYIKKISFE